MSTAQDMCNKFALLYQISWISAFLPRWQGNKVKKHLSNGQSGPSYVDTTSYLRKWKEKEKNDINKYKESKKIIQKAERKSDGSYMYINNIIEMDEVLELHKIPAQRLQASHH